MTILEYTARLNNITVGDVLIYIGNSSRLEFCKSTDIFSDAKSNNFVFTRRENLIMRVVTDIDYVNKVVHVTCNIGPRMHSRCDTGIILSELETSAYVTLNNIIRFINDDNPKQRCELI